MIINFTIECHCSFNCEVEVDEKISKRELMRRITSGELKPNIISENTYDFKGYTATSIQYAEAEYLDKP